MAKAKSVMTVFLFFALLFGAIIVPIVIMNEKEEEAEAFPEYQKIEITEKTTKTETSNAKTRKSLENDVYFKKFVTAPTYNYANIRKEIDPTTGLTYSYIEDGYLRNMITNFIFNYQLTNDGPLTNINYNTGYFCMTPTRVKESFEELYYSTISLNDFVENIANYIDLVMVENGNICFNFDKVSKMNDNELLVGIKKISVSKAKNIEADLYLYKFYINGTTTENSYVKKAKSYIDSRNYSAASDIVTNNLQGTVEHKKVVFKLNKRKKYFEYQLLYSAVIN